MKIKLLKMTMAILCWFFAFHSFADIPLGYTAKNDYFIISTSTPPALIYVTDSAGRMCGVNPTATLDQYGILKDQSLIVNTIPNSQAEQQNNGDPGNNFAPDPTTPWLITILDGGSQTYTINLKGISAGTQRVTVKDLPLGRPASPNGTKYYALIQPNVTNQIQVTVNSTAHTVAITPVVGNDGLLNDVTTACQLGLIKSSKVCKRLTKKAEEIQDALDNKHYEEARGLILSFLYSLGDSRPEGCQDEDDHGFVQQPALTILIEDAKALLAGLPHDDHHPHG
jgi:hypothetical protein